MSSIFNRFYDSQLIKLRKLSVEFSKANPAIAPMLGAESTDPDVERILEGVAFLNGITLQKIEDEFPEIAQELATVLVPQILRPLPATTMVVFTPKVPLMEITEIPAGTEIASIPVDGLSCLFRTTVSMKVLPIQLTTTKLTESSRGEFVIEIGLQGNLYAGGDNKIPLRFYLGDEQIAASNLMYLLRADQIKAIELQDQSGKSVFLSNQIVFPGFEEPLIPYPNNAFPGYRILQELFFFPQKFHYIEFSDIIKGSGILKGQNFTLKIHLKNTSQAIPSITNSSFLLNVAPVVNLFKHSAEPILANHQITEYIVLPEGNNKNQYQIYSIDSVIGFQQGDREQRNYVPFALLNFGNLGNQRSYRISLRNSSINNQLETYLTIIYGANAVFSNETLSIKLMCTNNALPESLKIGDVNKATSNSPDRFVFQNIRPITGSVEPPRSEELLWGVISHTALNFMSMGNVEHFRSLLSLYNFKRNKDHISYSTNSKMIDGISDLKVTQERRLYKGMILQGQYVQMTCKGINWPSLGSLYLWGSVFNHFLSSYSGLNSYTRFEIQDENTGTVMQWPIQVGQQELL